MAHDIFISHSSKDKLIADGICASLEAAGLRCCHLKSAQVSRKPGN